MMLFGMDSNGIPKLLALSADQSGLLSKRWMVSFPAGSLSASLSGLAFKVVTCCCRPKSTRTLRDEGRDLNRPARECSRNR